jgi:predicted  nucleic acid-binding Zn-ribbon protein
MFEIPEQLEKELDNVRRARDELKVRLHLGGAEIRDQWEKLDRGWQHLEGRMKVIGNESDEVAKDIGETLHVLAEQLRDGYERIKTLL